jgi:hypothetical protein
LTISDDIKASINYDKITEDERWDGLKGYITNTTPEAKTVYEEYSGLWQVERAFRITKGTPELRPMFHFTKNFRKMVDAEVNGEKYTPKQIKSVPSQLQKWMDENKDRIDAANNRETLPYRIKDNVKFTE